MTILDTFMVQFWRSMINKDLDQGRVEVLVRRCCEDRDQTLALSCTGAYQKIL